MYSASDVQSQTSDFKPAGIDLPPEEADEQPRIYRNDETMSKTLQRRLNKQTAISGRDTDISEQTSEEPSKRNTLMSMQNQREEEMLNGSRKKYQSFKFQSTTLHEKKKSSLFSKDLYED